MKDWLKGLFPHNKPVRWILTAFAVILLVSFATQCHGDEVKIRFEAGSTVARNESPALVVNVIKPHFVKDANGECFALLIGAYKESRGVMGFGCAIVDGFGPVDVGLGVVYLNHSDRLNGSQLNFMPQIGWRITDRFGITYRHISNSGTTPHNVGRDMVLFTYDF